VYTSIIYISLVQYLGNDRYSILIHYLFSNIKSTRTTSSFSLLLYLDAVGVVSYFNSIFVYRR
jgi:hypothetical protein